MTPANEPTVLDLFSLAGKVALLTGGCGHLGSAMARALSEAGASVVLTSREQAKAEVAARALPTVGTARHFGLARRLSGMAQESGNQIIEKWPR